MLIRPLIRAMPMKACQQAARASRSSEDGAGRPGPRAKFMRAIRSCFLALVGAANFGAGPRPAVTCNSIGVEKQLYHGADIAAVNTCPWGAKPWFSKVMRGFPYQVPVTE